MEIQDNCPLIRTFEYVKRRTLKDGTIKEYKYTGQYKVATKNVRCNKNNMQQRISACNDKNKLQLLDEFMTQNGI
jgi:predicted choloylglycine hydrolase